MSPELLDPLTLDEAESRWVATRADLTSSGDPTAIRSALDAIHELLIRATPLTPDAPTRLLDDIGDAVAGLDPDVVNSLSARPRVVIRLLAAGSCEAAWLVAQENSTGNVAGRTAGTTSSGASRVQPRRTLLTCIEQAQVYARLPGFRDPRYGAPDTCYEITGLVRLRARLETMAFEGGRVTLGGSASLAHLDTSAEERVRLIAVPEDEGGDVGMPGERHARPDLTGGSGEAMTRPHWAGWSVPLELNRLVKRPGDWELHVELQHQGIRRRTRLGRSVTELAEQCMPITMRTRRATVELAMLDQACRLSVTRRRLPRLVTD